MYQSEQPKAFASIGLVEYVLVAFSSLFTPHTPLQVHPIAREALNPPNTYKVPH